MYRHTQHSTLQADKKIARSHLLAQKITRGKEFVDKYKLSEAGSVQCTPQIRELFVPEVFADIDLKQRPVLD